MHPTKGRIRLFVGLAVILGIAGIVGLLFLSPIVKLFVQPSEPQTLTEALALPDSPENASYRLDDREILLREGTWEGRIPAESRTDSRISLTEATVQGDLNEDGQADALLILAKVGEGGDTSHYVAAALRDNDGYIGTNAVPLGERVRIIHKEIKHGVAVIEYLQVDANASFTDKMGASFVYLIVSGSELIMQGPLEQGEVVLWGDVTLEDNQPTFTPCLEQPRRLDRESRALPALELAYHERGVLETDSKKLFVALAGTVLDTPMEDGEATEKIFRARLVLAAPYEEMCGAAPLTDVEAAVP